MEKGPQEEKSKQASSNSQVLQRDLCFGLNSTVYLLAGSHLNKTIFLIIAVASCKLSSVDCSSQIITPYTYVDECGKRKFKDKSFHKRLHTSYNGTVHLKIIFC